MVLNHFNVESSVRIREASSLLIEAKYKEINVVFTKVNVCRIDNWILTASFRLLGCGWLVYMIKYAAYVKVYLTICYLVELGQMLSLYNKFGELVKQLLHNLPYTLVIKLEKHSNVRSYI